MKIYILEWYGWRHNSTSFLCVFEKLELALRFEPKPKDTDGELILRESWLNTIGSRVIQKRVIYTDGTDEGWKPYD